MNHRNRIANVRAILFLLLVLCPGMAQAQAKPAAQEKPTAQETADMKEVRAFRLTMDNLASTTRRPGQLPK